MLSYSILLAFTPVTFWGLWFDGGRGGDPFRRPNSKLPGDNGNRKPLPPGMGGMLLAALFLVGFALLLGAYRGAENIRPVDIFLMAVLALLLSRLVRGRTSRGQDKQNDDWNRNRNEPRESALDSDNEDEDEAEAYWRRREEEERRDREQDLDEDQGSPSMKSDPLEDPWDRYRSWPKYSKSMESNGDEPPSFPKIEPHGFDQHEFITGAKILFEKVQEAVACCNPDTIQSFLSDQAAAEVEQIIQEQPAPQSCSILTLDASIKDILEKGESTIVTVIFNAIIHTGSDNAPRETEVVWRFSRAHAQDNWRLDSLSA